MRPGDEALAVPGVPGETVETGQPDETGSLLVRYWAGARAAAGIEQEYVPLTGDATVADVVAQVSALHPDLERILAVSSLLVDGRAARPEESVGGAATLEVLPPFAGG